jgi:Lrp/AsnC family leucine-responsive transcriptional regulator
VSDSADTDLVADRLNDVGCVEDCWFVAGEETFVIKVRVADVSGLEQAIRSITAVPGVSRTRTTVVLSTKFEGRV